MPVISVEDNKPLLHCAHWNVKTAPRIPQAATQRSASRYTPWLPPFFFDLIPPHVVPLCNKMEDSRKILIPYLFGNTNFGSVLISLIILSLSWHRLIKADQAVLTLDLGTRLYFLNKAAAAAAGDGVWRWTRWSWEV